MLSIKNLVKVYKTKGGVNVRALNGINIDFPETGMIFLLGKSGSGKSTLLNVTGGLDVPTEGEIIVKGKSSKDFAQEDWDSYRNTFIGFIFQEYNILEEFTVGQNIALALQLQSKPSDAVAVSKILKDVDLEGYEKRKPNTLSGGQRQRVAIARALIKNPEIIMADEPTGALDSETGKQIFETLKKLSKERLVIVVSHDRDFAESYADRIIELEDGKVISDITKEEVAFEQENLSVHDGETLTVKDWKKLSKADLEKIVSLMSKNEGETVITKNKNGLSEIKKIAGVKEGGKKVFGATKKVDAKQYDSKALKFIKSKLPLKNALKMAFGSIKAKPIRLTFTILLSLIAFVFFGVSSTLMLYNSNYSIATAIELSNYDAYVLRKYYHTQATEYYYANEGMVEGDTFASNKRGAYTEQDIENFNNNELGLNFIGIYDFGTYMYSHDNVEGYMANDAHYSLNEVSYAKRKYYGNGKFIGVSDAGESFLKNNGFELVAGSYPTKSNEVAISRYVYEQFLYSTSNSEFVNGAYVNKYNTPEEFIGEKINFYKNSSISLTVTGIYDMGKIPEKYDVLLDENSGLSPKLLSEISEELNDYLMSSFHKVLFVSDEFYDEYKKLVVNINVRYCRGVDITHTGSWHGVIGVNDSVGVYTKKSIWQYDSYVDIYDLDGNIIPLRDYNLEKNQALVSLSQLEKEAIELGVAVILNPEYEEFVNALTRYSSGTYSVDDISLIMSTTIKDYEKILGKELAYSKKIQIRNASGKMGSMDTVGFYLVKNNLSGSDYYFVSDELCDEYEVIHYDNVDGSYNIKHKTEYQVDAINEKYGKIMSIGNRSFDQTYFVLTEDGVVYNTIENQAYSISSQMASIIKNAKPLFYILSALFGVFASLMMFNFITVSISSKTKEIGILRAVGARGFDVFKIFITEAFIIMGICFVFSAVLSSYACQLMNMFIMYNVLQISILDYSIINILMLFGASSLVSILATVFPVVKASKKSPVDSIRSL